MLTAPVGRRLCIAAFWLALGAYALAAHSATPAAPDSAPLSGPQAIQLLDKTIDWYRTLGIQQQAANQPSDLLILFDNRQTANRVIALAFDIARADASLLESKGEGAVSATTTALNQPIIELQTKFARQATVVQADLEADEKLLPTLSGKAASDLQAKISVRQGELDLLTARRQLLATMLEITADSDANGFSASALKAQIDGMAATLSAPSGATLNPAGVAQSPTVPDSAFAPLTGTSVSSAVQFGIWDLGSNVLRLSEKISTIDGLDRRTEDLARAFAEVRAPLVVRLKGLSAQGDALARAADAADTAQLNQTRQQMDLLGEQFKSSSALLVPLGKISVLLGQYRHNLDNWRGIIRGQYRDALKTLGVRVLVLLVVLALLFIASEAWRRAVIRYAHEVRRRYQLLLLRRIVLWTLVVLTVGFALSSQISTLFTFAGIITAGLAVAMQSVLVSFVGYFFLIGKYGIRVGDRVQIGEVVGEVIDLGLVRLHLMELGSKGLYGPTGRVVAFPNSIVFQVATGLFKQIPGVNMTWREVSLALPAGLDYGRAKEMLLQSISAVLQDSREEISRQANEIQRSTASNSGGDSQPRVQLSFSGAGVEAKVRYPVHLDNAAEIDERVSRELQATLHQMEPERAS